jgi:hypothetical protein
VKLKQRTLLIALTLLASASAYAGRDEALIQQTRKNQLAHEAKMKKERQEQQQQQRQAGQPGAAPSSSEEPHTPTGQK